MTASFRYPSIDDYGDRYREAACTPIDVARRVIEATARSDRHDPAMRAFIAQSADDILEQAEASAKRYRSGEPLGPLDGVPVAVKDELDQLGYGTTAGTCFLGTAPSQRDATAVARLRQQGALLIGKTNMHEVGLGVTGINPHHGSARNPHDPTAMTGGSSSGSAAAVALGLCPVALGVDGGGSIRIPAALCGISGIKPTFGRVSNAGTARLGFSLGHVGPLAASLRDAATVLGIIAGPDDQDRDTIDQPALAVGLQSALDPRKGRARAPALEGLRVGWCPAWAARAQPGVLRICEDAVAAMVSAGAQRIVLDLPHLDLTPPAMYLTFAVELATALYERRRDHVRDFAPDTRLLLELAHRIPAVDYLRAQRVRSQIHDSLTAALASVDLLATPMTATTAPALRSSALEAGERDDAVLEALTAFAFAANLTGQPAISVPAGYGAGELPVGLQLIGSHWQEATLIRAGLFVEALCERRAPRVLYPILC